MITIPIEIGTVELTFGVDFPNINFDCDFTGDGTVIPSKRYHLGSIALSWEDVSLDIPVSAELPIYGRIDFSLDRNNAECVVSGSINTPVKDFPLGEVRFAYMNPLRLVEPEWSKHPTKLNLPSLQSKINALPADQYKSDTGAQNLQSDEYTQDLLRGILTFAGAGDFLDQMMDLAQGLKSAYSPRMNSQGASGNNGLVGSVGSDVLLAIALGETAALTEGVSEGAGLFFDTSGVFGAFGSIAQDLGLIASLSAGLSVLLYWPVTDSRTGVTLSAMECFTGYNIFAAGDADLGLGVGAAFYWPASAPSEASSLQVCGLGLSVGAGLGVPFQFYEGNSETIPLVTLGAFLTVFAASPIQGPIAGGTPVSIQGTGFKPGLQVSFGDTPVQGFLKGDDQSVVVITPSHDKGIVDIKVTLNGHSAVLPNSFDYS